MVATRKLPVTEAATPLHSAVRRDPPPSVALPPVPKLTREAIESFMASGRRLLIQGGMGLHASDGLAGPVAAAPSRRFVPVGTVSAVQKTEEGLVAEIRRARARAPFGYVGINLMAALHHGDFEAMAKTALAEGVSFVIQGAGISREVIRWCREAGTPFVGIVSSGRLAKLYEKWGADFLVAEGSDAGGHIGDIGEHLPDLLAEVLAATTLPVIAAGGIVGADIGRFLDGGAAGVQLATRFIACSDGDTHPAFKEMHLGKTEDDVVVITSTVKGMKARAIRNRFTDALAAGEVFPPVAKAWFYGREGFRGRRKSCVACLAAELCVCRESGFQESFCITDALLRAAVLGDKEMGLFYSGQSVTRIPETDVSELKSAAELIATLEEELEAYESAAAPA